METYDEKPPSLPPLGPPSIPKASIGVNTNQSTRDQGTSTTPTQPTNQATQTFPSRNSRPTNASRPAALLPSEPVPMEVEGEAKKGMLEKAIELLRHAGMKVVRGVQQNQMPPIPQPFIPMQFQPTYIPTPVNYPGEI